MKCPACGTDNPDAALYCGMCKVVFKKAAPAPARAELSVDTLLAQGVAHARQKRFADALALFDRAVAQQPGLALAHEARAAALHALGRRDDAGRAWQTAYRLAPPAPLPIRPGERIGPYAIERRLGEGGFGVVYLAHDTRTGERYALKSFREERAADPNARAGFRVEAQIWVDLERHPNIVRAHVVEELAGRLFIAMEFIEPARDGVNSLDGALAKRTLAIEQCVRWGVQICHAMEHAQAKGLRCHRDLKPNNILLARDNTIKVTDFGLAVVGRAKGEVAGTPHFMPPEQWGGAPAD